MYTISQIKLSLHQDFKEFPNIISKKLKCSPKDIFNIRIIKESIDARNKEDIKKVYTLDFSSNKKLKCQLAKNRDYILPEARLDKNTKIAVVGFGPAGIFASYILAELGYRPIVFERGKRVEERKIDVEHFWASGELDEESNVQFGEGGAGTFSDGKLTTGIKDLRIQKVLSELVNHGAKKEILYQNKAHIGTDKLVDIISNIREKIISMGGTIEFSTKVVDIITDEKNKKIEYLIVEKRINEDIIIEKIKVDKVIFATGHSSREIFSMMYEKGFNMEQKPISMGFRIRHKQSLINEAQYGSDDVAKILGAAEYKLNHRLANGRGVYTFCMCPGGDIIMSSSQKGCLVSNGMSNSQRNGEFANSGLLVDVKTSDYGSPHALAGMYFQEKYERKAFELSGGYNLLTTTYKDFKHSKLYQALPEFVSESILESMVHLGKKLKGFDSEDTVFQGIETRSSSPVRVLRNNNYETNIKGVFVAGEGPGYAGGIMSASVDGIKVAEAIVQKAND